MSERVCGHAQGRDRGLSGSLRMTKSGVDTLGYAGCDASLPDNPKAWCDAQPFNSEDQTSVPAPDAPQLPPGLDPGYDQANAAPGAQQPVYGHTNGQPAYGQALLVGAYATCQAVDRRAAPGVLRRKIFRYPQLPI